MTSTPPPTPAPAEASGHPRPWRTGRRYPRNIYDANDVGIVMAPDEETARRIVEAVNARAASAHQTPAGGGQADPVCWCSDYPPCPPGKCPNVPRAPPPPPEGPSYPNGPLTPEQQQRLAEVRAKWDEKFADTMEAIREAGRITETDLSIHVTGAELPPEGPSEPSDEELLRIEDDIENASVDDVIAIGKRIRRALFTAGRRFAEEQARAVRHQRTLAMDGLLADARFQRDKFLELCELAQAKQSAAAAKVKDLEGEVLHHKRLIGAVDEALRDLDLPGDRVEAIAALKERADRAETDRDKTGELFNAALADYNAEKERAERAERDRDDAQRNMRTLTETYEGWRASLTQELAEEKRRGGELDRLRAEGWVVAVHNDYHLNGVPHTFWLFTQGAHAAKGEGLTDAEALAQVRAAIDRLRSSRAEQGGKSDG